MEKETTVTAEEVFLPKLEDWHALERGSIEYYYQTGKITGYLFLAIRKSHIEFAKIKVKEALEAAAKNARTITTEVYNGTMNGDWDSSHDKVVEVNKYSILNSYDIESIR